ncbi:MAG: 3-methyl-2-oxobutanoate hydroxymethyltransferase [Spirochaetaceae bacterium]|jgi:3-methyl-2-oxobutanoate hydroxymethyltransferase|nr:3-methyl-2-oxobutanoate hydroxymethyltransferase [Spirochaetaceae bacterium]
MKKKMTVLDFKKFKEEGRKFTYVTAYDYTTASIVNDSETEVILVGDSLGMVMLGYGSTTGVTLDDMIHHTRPVVKGAPDTFVVGDMPFGSYNVSVEDAIRSANRIIKEAGPDCVKLEGGVEFADTVAAITRAGVPVMGHIGLTPQTTSQLGGFKVQGGTPAGAAKLIADAKALEEAGAFSVVLECVPSVVAKAITQALTIPVLGIGAGPYVDCQVLVLQDMLGMFGDFKPKFVKRYAQLRRDMVEALNTFHRESLDGSFPSPEYSFNAKVEGYS